jgi:hypothetical protein
MKYYVWIEYYAAAPVSKSVKSNEFKYADKHQHGVQPTQSQVDDLQGSLQTNVAAAYATYNGLHPTAVVAYPGNAAVQAARSVKTRSAY